MELIDQVKKVVAESLEVPLEQLTDDAKPEDFGASSLAVIELAFDLEEKFDIDISPNSSRAVPMLDSDMMSMSITDIARAIKLLIDAKAA